MEYNIRQALTCAECDFLALEEWELRQHEARTGHTHHGGWSNLWLGGFFHVPHLRGGKRVLAVIGLIILTIIMFMIGIVVWGCVELGDCSYWSYLIDALLDP